MDNHRRKRLRLLLGKLNKERKEQAKRTDILCKDLVNGFRSFVERLGAISFTANFYKDLLGQTDLKGIITVAMNCLQDETDQANIAFFIRSDEGFKSFVRTNPEVLPETVAQIEDVFSPELIENICLSNKVCDMDALYELGMQISASLANRISAVALPLTEDGIAFGFMFVWLPAKDLKLCHINRVSSISTGLARAIQRCQMIKQ